MLPAGEDVWESFWIKEAEEKQSRTRSFGMPFGRAFALAESLISAEDSWSKAEERAQKHVTNMISYCADSKAGMMVEL